MVLSMIRVFSYPLEERSFFISYLISSKQLFFVSGRISPQVLKCFNKPTTSLFVSLLVFQQPRCNLLGRVLSKLIVAEVGIFFFILLFQWSIFYSFFQSHCDVALLTHSRVWSRSCSFRAYPFNRSVVSPLQVLFILSSLASLFNRSAVWNPSYPLCLSFDSSRGSVLLISSSIIPSYQVHILFLPIPTGVMS